jgi:hypothetical protein
MIRRGRAVVAGGRWRAVFRVVFLIPKPVMRLVTRLLPGAPIKEVRIVGRRSGLERRYLPTELDIDGRCYVGHPNGRSQWIRNLLAAGSAVVVGRDGPVMVRPVELGEGRERDAAIRQTATQPFPAGQVYAGAQHHLRAAAVYLRLDPMTFEDAMGGRP